MNTCLCLLDSSFVIPCATQATPTTIHHDRAMRELKTILSLSLHPQVESSGIFSIPRARRIFYQTTSLLRPWMLYLQLRIPHFSPHHLRCAQCPHSGLPTAVPSRWNTPFQPLRRINRYILTARGCQISVDALFPPLGCGPPRRARYPNGPTASESGSLRSNGTSRSGKRTSFWK